ncbi:integral peroxisomal membrane peroxin-domain-containing protein [Kalaharituber pfeilii]|nr:integral peroxisomal membrane peroxin-domain-containing protein [Kalaharituber pfeilii]
MMSVDDFTFSLLGTEYPLSGYSDDSPDYSDGQRQHRRRRSLLDLPGHRRRSRSRSPQRHSVPDAHMSSPASQLAGDKSLSGQLQDRTFAKILQQIIPSDYNLEKYAEMTDKRKDIDRPQLSLTLMSANFRRFNARVGVVFVFQHRLLRVLSWKQPTHTLSAMVVYSFVCLDPHLLAALPLAIILLFIMVPAYITRHPPPPPSIPGKVEPYSAHGGPIAPPPEIKAVSEMSKDFFRNLRDLQNLMSDFSEAHDQIIATIGPPTNFSNEQISSGVFQLLFAICIAAFIGAYLIPWNLVFLVWGWFAISLFHPTVQDWLLSTSDSEFAEQEKKKAIDRFTRWVEKDIVIDETPETREVEIFELQRMTGWEWEPWMYSSSPYEPLSPARIAGHRPKGTRFFEDVRPPAGWEFKDKKWILDLASKTWVAERCVNGVEVDEEKERWVYDWVEEMESDDETGVRRPVQKRGEWRRRRWVRTVVRKQYQRREGE